MLLHFATARAPASHSIRADRVSLRVSNGRIRPGRLMPFPLVVDELGRGGCDAEGRWRGLMFTVYCRAQRVQWDALWHNRGPASGPSENKNGPFWGQLVKNNDRKYAFRKSFKNFGKIRIFVRFRIRSQTISYPN